jgi:hypothetical protein
MADMARRGKGAEAAAAEAATILQKSLRCIASFSLAQEL